MYLRIEKTLCNHKPERNMCIIYQYNIICIMYKVYISCLFTIAFLNNNPIHYMCYIKKNNVKEILDNLLNYSILHFKVIRLYYSKYSHTYYSTLNTNTLYT